MSRNWIPAPPRDLATPKDQKDPIQQFIDACSVNSPVGQTPQLLSAKTPAKDSFDPHAFMENIDSTMLIPLETQMMSLLMPDFKSSLASESAQAAGKPQTRELQPSNELNGRTANETYPTLGTKEPSTPRLAPNETNAAAAESAPLPKSASISRFSTSKVEDQASYQTPRTAYQLSSEPDIISQSDDGSAAVNRGVESLKVLLSAVNGNTEAVSHLIVAASRAMRKIHASGLGAALCAKMESVCDNDDTDNGVDDGLIHQAEWVSQTVMACEGAWRTCDRLCTVFSRGGVSSKKRKLSEFEEEVETSDSVAVDQGQLFIEWFESSAIALEAAILCLTIIHESSNAGMKRKVGEETMASLITFVKHEFDEVFAAVALCSDHLKEDETHQQLKNILDQTESRKKLQRVTLKLCDIVKLIAEILQFQAFTDSLLISTYTMCIPAFFQDSNSLSVVIGMENIQLLSIQVVQAIFSSSPMHQMPIMEEIAGYLTKLQPGKKGLRQFKLRNGKAMMMVSALILQLMQSIFCCTEVSDVIQEVTGSLTSLDDGNTSFFAGKTFSVDKLLATAKRGFDSAHASGMFFFKYVLSRAFAENSKGDRLSSAGRRSLVVSTENELRGILDNLLDDFLLVLQDPEWPSADFLLLVFCKIMIQSLDEKKHADSALKGLALDFLGQLTSRLFSYAKPPTYALKSEVAVDDAFIERFSAVLTDPVAVATNLNAINIRELWGVQSLLINGLKESQDDSFSFCARVFHVFVWINSMQNIFTGAFGDNVDVNISESIKSLLLQYCDSTKRQMLGVLNRFNSSESDIFQLSHAGADPRTWMQMAHWALLRRSPLQNLRETLLAHTLSCLNSDAITIRTRALKALSEIVSVDADVLSLGSVRGVISQRLLDPSKMVREAAVDLLGGYLMKAHSEQLVGEYYPMLIPRILDVGAGVRKRVMKLMKEIVLHFSAKEASEGAMMGEEMSSRLVEIVCKILGRLSDEETSIKDLGLKSLAEIFFSPFKHTAPTTNVYTHTKGETVGSILSDAGKRSVAFVEQSMQAKFEIKCRAALASKSLESLIGNGNNLTHADLFGDMVKTILDSPSSIAKRRDVVIVCRSLVECLIEMVLAFEEIGDRESVKNTFVTLNQLGRAIPQLLQPHVKIMHTYLKLGEIPRSNENTSKFEKVNDERITASAVSMLGLVVPCLNDPDLSFMSSIEGDLLLLLSRGSLPVVYLVVPCLSSIVHLLTGNYFKLTRVLRTCLENFGKSKQMMDAAHGNTLNAANTRAIARGLIVVSLLVRNFDFDKNRSRLAGQALLDVEDYPNVLAIVLSFVSFFVTAGSTELKTVALQALGNLFIAHPKLMIRRESQELMNGIFSSGMLAHKIELIKTFVEFLKTEQIRMMNEESKSLVALCAKIVKLASSPSKSVDIRVLIGNADEMADAGVSSAVMQMYLSHILDGLVSVNPTLSFMAFDAVCIIIEQGLAHPLLCVPYIVAMQTSKIRLVRDRAVLVYENLAEKYQTFIHSRTAECVKKAFDYQYLLASSENENMDTVWPQGYSIQLVDSGGDDDGNNTYERPIALLSHMYVKIQAKRQRRNEFLDPQLIAFGRFVAENLATLNYRSIDEVLLVIHHSCQILSVSGETMLKFVEEWKAGVTSHDQAILLANAKSSVLLGMLIILNRFLQKLYSLSESKCRQFVPSDTARNTEKLRPAVTNSSADSIINWNRWKYADSATLVGRESIEDQLDLFMQLMNTDYYASDDCSIGADDEDLSFTAEIAPPAPNDLNVRLSSKKRTPAHSIGPDSPAGAPAKKARRSIAKSKIKVKQPLDEGPPDRPKRTQNRRVSIVEVSSEDEAV
ncbi:hypothetical protein HDU83_000296 [Entophlyctis luteolus]|nr:hypothetical protein HDU83_000296 [Entophlyctis luteolus]